MKIGMFFSGYKKNTPGIGKDLYDAHRLVQEYLEEASYCLETDMTKLSFSSSQAEMNDMVHAYPLLYIWQSASAALLKQQGIIPARVGGSGVGFFSALHAAHGISIPDALYVTHKIAQRYTQLLEDHNYMLAYLAGMVDVRKAEAHGVFVVLRDEQSFAVMGPRSLVETLSEEMKTGLNELPLEMLWNGQFGEEIAAHINAYGEKFDIVDTSIPVVATTDGSLLQTGSLLKQELVNQCTQLLEIGAVFDAFSDCDVLIMPFVDGYFEHYAQQRLPHVQIMRLSSNHDVELIVQKCGKAPALPDTGDIHEV